MSFARLDEAVLARAERASHWIQLRSGMTCFDVARLCHLLTFGIAATVVSTVRFEQASLAVLGSLLSFAAMFCIIMWRAYGEVADHYGQHPDAAHPYTIIWREQQLGHRMLVLTVGVPAFLGYGIWHFVSSERAAMVLALALLCWAGALYLQCCIPMPPGAVREFREARERRRAEAAAHAVGTHSPV